MNSPFSASTHMPMEVIEDHGWFTVTTTPAHLPFRVTVSSWLVALIPACLLSIYTTIRLPNGGWTFLVVGALAWLASGWLVNRLYAAYHNHQRRVQANPFQVSTMGIRTPAGALIPADQVAAVNLGNTLSGRTVVFAGTGVAAGVAHLGAAALDRLVTVSYTSEVEHRGQNTVLAGGLTEAQARAVCAEVVRRLAGDVRQF